LKRSDDSLPATRADKTEEEWLDEALADPALRESRVAYLENKFGHKTPWLADWNTPSFDRPERHERLVYRGLKLRAMLDAIGLSVSKAAGFAGVSRQTMTKWLGGAESDPFLYARAMARLSENFHGFNYEIALQLGPDKPVTKPTKETIPPTILFFGYVPGDDPPMYGDFTNSPYRLEAWSPWVVEGSFVVTCDDDSMYPTIYRGDILLCSRTPSTRKIKPGRIVLAYSRETKRAVLRSLAKSGRSFLLVPDNPAFSALRDGWEVIAVVDEVTRLNPMSTYKWYV